MPKRTAASAAGALLAALLLSAPALAGWKIEEVDPEFPEEVTTYRFQGGKVRVDGALEGLTVLLDLKKEEGWLVDPALKRFAGGKLADLTEQLKKLETDTAAEEALPGDDEEESDAGAPEKPPQVVVKDLGSGGKLLSHDTHRYQVLVDGELLEEIWMAPKVDAEREVDLIAFASAMQKMLGGGSGMNQGYEDDAAYRALRKVGYPLKQILYFVGEKSTVEVRSAEQKALPEADFVVPAGLKKVGYVELLVGEGE